MSAVGSFNQMVSVREISPTSASSLEKLFGTKPNKMAVAIRTGTLLCKIVGESQASDKEGIKPSSFKFALITSPDEVDKAIAEQRLVFIRFDKADKSILTLFGYKDYSRLQLPPLGVKMVLAATMDAYTRALNLSLGIGIIDYWSKNLKNLLTENASQTLRIKGFDVTLLQIDETVNKDGIKSCALKAIPVSLQKELGALVSNQKVVFAKRGNAYSNVSLALHKKWEHFSVKEPNKCMYFSDDDYKRLAVKCEQNIEPFSLQ